MSIEEALNAWRALSVVQRESVLHILSYEADRDGYPPLPAFSAAHGLLRAAAAREPLDPDSEALRRRPDQEPR